MSIVANKISHTQTEEPTAGLLDARHLCLEKEGKTILHDITLSIPSSGITTLIGPSGAGKSSLLRCLNLLDNSWQGSVTLHQKSLNRRPEASEKLRRHIGLIAQKPCVFPTSIFRNVVFGIQGFWQRRRAQSIAEQALRTAALWDEVKERLESPAETLSVGQQQRLCIARALAINPQLLMLDEPTASLDPRSKQLIEHSLLKLAENTPLILVTHDLQQAQRLDGQTIFMCDGKIIEQSSCHDFFTQPRRVESKEFLRWSSCDCN